MRVEGFGSAYDREAEKMESRLRAAQTKDGKRMKSGDRKRKLVQAVIKGDSSVTFRTSYEPELLRWIAVIRNWFAGISIRRHLQSVDNTGARILGLGPIHKHALLVKLYQHELDNLEAVAEELIRDGTHRVAKSAGSAVRASSLFSFSFRRRVFPSQPRISMSICARPCSILAALHAIRGRIPPRPTNGD